MSMKNEHPKLKSPGFIGKTATPIEFPSQTWHVTHKMWHCVISLKLEGIQCWFFSVNNYDGIRSIILKNYNDHLIRMGGCKGSNIPPPKNRNLSTELEGIGSWFFSVNNYDGIRSIILKNYNDHLIRMGV